MTDAGGAELRHEIKFAAYATEYERLRHWLRMHPSGFVKSYPDRQVNNVYFDSWDYCAFAENLAGISRRCKLRFRWYGNGSGPTPGALEVKQKRNQLGWKQRYAVEQDLWAPGTDWKDFRAAIRSQIPPHARLWFDQYPLPIMLNRYQRSYFTTADRRIRATIDTGQQAFDQRQGTRPNLRRPAVMQNTLVVEFKFAPGTRPAAADLLADMPFRLGRHSKYMNALRSIAMVGGRR